jgi:hypothetical protein
MREWLIDLLLTCADWLHPKPKKTKGMKGGKPTHALWTQTHSCDNARVVERPEHPKPSISSRGSIRPMLRTR